MTYRSWGQFTPIAVLLWLVIGLLGHVTAAPTPAASAALLAVYGLLVASATRYALAIIRSSRKVSS